MFDTVLGILGLALLMVVHESGHFFAARAYGMRVTRFSIGFGPTLFRILPRDGYFWLTAAADKFEIRLFRHDPAKHGPTIYQVALIPFLAYVQIAGMNPLEEGVDTDKGSYANASLMGRIVTIFSGPFANYLFASLFFFASFFFGGKPERSNTTNVTIVPDQPAAAAHMKDGDRVLEVGGTAVADWDQMAAAISKHPAETIPIVVQRGEERLTLKITPANKAGKGRIGVMATILRVKLTFKESAYLAVTEPPEVVKQVVLGLGQLVTGKAQVDDVEGPIGIVKKTAKAAKMGWSELAYILGSISAYLGAFNLIPFPALDGGRLMFLGYEATTRRKPNARIEQGVHAIGIVMMLSLMVWVTVADLRK